MSFRTSELTTGEGRSDTRTPLRFLGLSPVSGRASRECDFFFLIFFLSFLFLLATKKRRHFCFSLWCERGKFSCVPDLGCFGNG